MTVLDAKGMPVDVPQLTYEELVSQRDALHRLFHEFKSQRDRLVRALSTSEKIRYKLGERIQKLAKQETHMVAALKFYGDLTNYQTHSRRGPSNIIADCGGVARNALG